MELITPVLNDTDKKPLYLQLYSYIKKEIEMGRLQSHTRLPSVRKLSAHLGISVTTVRMTYDHLLSEGYIESKERSGFFVVALDEEFFHDYKENDSSISSYTAHSSPIDIDFHIGKIDRTSFPHTVWNKISNLAMKADEDDLLFYGYSQGEPSLRHELAHYLRYSRGVYCDEEQIIITSGTQQAIGLLCQTLGEEHHTVGFEEPGYHHGRLAFTHHGYKIYPIPLQNDGLDVEVLQRTETRLVYTTPNHQFPCGMIMPISNRIALLNWATSSEGYVIEDDYDGEFRYNRKPLSALQGLDQNDRVIYLGTFSKTFNPALRVSYMVLPKRLVSIYQNKFIGDHSPVSKHHQMALHLFIREGYWEQHLRRIRSLYKKKHRTMVQAIDKWMKGKVRLDGESAGLHVMIEVLTGQDVIELEARAAKEGIQVYTRKEAWINPAHSQNYIFLGFASLSYEQIEHGIMRLSKIWFS